VKATFTLILLGEGGDGKVQGCVVTDARWPEIPPLLYVRIERPAEIGSRFGYGGLAWELVAERHARPGAIEDGDTFWPCKPAEQ